MLDADDDEERVTLSGIPRSSYTRWWAQGCRWKAWPRKTGCRGLDHLVHLGKASNMEKLFFGMFRNLHLTADC
jgi:hypothetical protein